MIENTFRYQVFFAVCGRDEVGESSDVADAAAIETFGANEPIRWLIDEIYPAFVSQSRENLYRWSQPKRVLVKQLKQAVDRLDEVERDRADWAKIPERDRDSRTNMNLKQAHDKRESEFRKLLEGLLSAGSIEGEGAAAESDLRAALKQNHKELQPAQIRWQAYRDEEKRLQTAAPPRQPFARIGTG